MPDEQQHVAAQVNGPPPALHRHAPPLSGAAMSNAMIKAISPKPTRMCGAVRLALTVNR